MASNEKIKKGIVMAEEYPYMISNNKIEQILNQIRVAAKPTKFTHSLLKQLGFISSNDRAIIPLLKRLGFLNDAGVPTEFYDELKDNTRYKFILADRIRDLYTELYSINTTIHDSNDDEIKGAISRVTGKDEKTVNRYFTTFKAISSIADFNKKIKTPNEKEPEKQDKEKEKKTKVPHVEKIQKPDFHYNIQIHLPATTEISVYNAIFQSLKENLL